MNPFSLYARHGGLADAPMTEGPTYPAESACWHCGHVVTGSPTVSLRICRNGHEEVRWNERLPGVAWVPPMGGNQRTLETACP